VVLASWAASDRMLAAVLIDQMVRNWAAVEDVSDEVLQSADFAALHLATGVAAEHFSGEDAAGVQSDVALFCFFTLVFRHTDRATVVATSVSLLERALAGGYAATPIPPEGPARELCLRFLAESHGKELALRSELYISQALEQDTPSDISDTTGESIDNDLDLTVLDELCQRQCSTASQFLPAFIAGTENADTADLCDHTSVLAMGAALQRDGVGPDDTLLLSLSGGVDSTAHAVMLALLQPRFGFRLAALHLHHLNRDDALVEQRWVQMLARRLGIVLFGYTVRLQRPHGDTRAGISRERYEDVTKRIRFRMYRLSLEATAARAAGVGRHLVVLGHHEDDADENRLAELGKGNVVDIDGMEVLSKCMGVTQYRPLLRTRKCSMYSLAEVARIPFMADSTPPWSRRGWTRRVLDALPAVERDSLLHTLSRLGVESSALGCKLERMGEELTSVRVLTLAGWPPSGSKIPTSLATPGGASKVVDARVPDALGQVAAVKLSAIAEMAHRAGSSLDQVLGLALKVAVIWNAAITRQARTDSGDEPSAPPCPLQPVLVHTRITDPGIFAFVHSVKRHLVRPDVLPFLNGGQVTGKSLAHIVSMVRGAKDPSAPIWSTLNSRCPCLWIPAIDTLVLYNEMLMSEMTRSATMKRSLVKASIEALTPR
jgi:tRNA(Ile)-lysidine synthase TilS/MesJ